MSYPVSLNEVKQHLGIDADDFDKDGYIESILIPSAIQYCNNLIDPSVLITDASCPGPIKSAILISCWDLYENRGSNILGSVKRDDVILRLLMPYRTITW